MRAPLSRNVEAFQRIMFANLTKEFFFFKFFAMVKIFCSIFQFDFSPNFTNLILATQQWDAVKVFPGLRIWPPILNTQIFLVTEIRRVLCFFII